MIFKLKYQDKAQAVSDLTDKGILTEHGYGEGVHAVVEIGVIALDENTNADGYHYDIMSDNTYDFGANLIEPKNPKHQFAGNESDNNSITSEN
jgi:hypothetical protein